MSVTVVIAIFGDTERWSKIALRAAQSVVDQTVLPDKIFLSDGDHLAAARNGAAAWAKTEWLCFLDGDDSLDPRYIETMLAKAETLGPGDWLLQPSTLGIYPDGREDPFPVVIPRKPLLDGNFMVVGTFIKTEQFLRVGGFLDWEAWEDWDLWVRAWLDGAKFETVPEAIYRVMVRPDSRNSLSPDKAQELYHRMRSGYLADPRSQEREP